MREKRGAGPLTEFRLMMLVLAVGMVVGVLIGALMGRPVEAAGQSLEAAMIEHYRELRWLESERNRVLEDIGREIAAGADCACE